MKIRVKSYIFIIVISIIVSIPLFNKNFNIYLDDGIQHVCRLMGTYQSITEGQPFSVIMSNFCNGFGYSWNLFYSPITAYVPLLFHLFTNSFVSDLKIFMLIVTILSGISMYEFLNKVTKNKYVGLLGAAIYILAPYRLTDMYMRIAVAELTSFIFLPMIFQGIYTIFSDEENDRKKSGLLLALGAIGLILSHTVIAMYTAIIGMIYVVIHIKKLKDKNILKKLVINFILILCITSFFWAPMLEHKLATQYEVFKAGRMERTDVLIYYKLDFINFLYTGQGKMSFEIGLVTLIGIVLTLLTFKKVEKRYKGLYIFSLIAGIISVIMTLKYFPFEKLPSVLKILQFSFRMLEFSSFFLAIVASINYATLIRNFNIKDVIILATIALFLVIPLTKNLQYKDDNMDESNLWPAVRVTQATKRVHAGCASFEYLPSRAFENLNYIKTREDKVYILDGNTQIQNEEKNGTNMKFNIQNTEENTVLELPYIYYLGYNVTIQDGEEKTKLETYESENGFIEIHLNEGEEGDIMIEYTGDNTMKISIIVSIIGFSVMILYYCMHNLAIFCFI